eukprot:scaffold1.g5698.t1
MPSPAGAPPPRSRHRIGELAQPRRDSSSAEPAVTVVDADAAAPAPAGAARPQRTTRGQHSKFQDSTCVELLLSERKVSGSEEEELASEDEEGEACATRKRSRGGRRCRRSGRSGGAGKKANQKLKAARSDMPTAPDVLAELRNLSPQAEAAVDQAPVDGEDKTAKTANPGFTSQEFERRAKSYIDSIWRGTPAQYLDKLIHMVKALPQLAAIAVQDAVDREARGMAGANQVVGYLKRHPMFTRLVEEHKAKLASGFDVEAPRSQHEMLREMTGRPPVPTARSTIRTGAAAGAAPSGLAAALGSAAAAAAPAAAPAAPTPSGAAAVLGSAAPAAMPATAVPAAPTPSGAAAVLGSAAAAAAPVAAAPAAPAPSGAAAVLGSAAAATAPAAPAPSGAGAAIRMLEAHRVRVRSTVPTVVKMNKAQINAFVEAAQQAACGSQASAAPAEDAAT